MEFMLEGGFWLSVVQIIAIDVLLGGDNAVVIALACRRLPPHQRNRGIFWGVVGAIGLRIALIYFALYLLALPFLKIVGGLLLMWIGVKLLLPEAQDEHGRIEGGTTLFAAVRTVVIADAVMSLDNVIAVAAAAKGDLALVIFGILVSIPLIVWGSKFVLRLMDRFPLVIVLGGALLGWIAGGMLVSDVVAHDWIANRLPHATLAAGLAGAALVVVLGRWLSGRMAARSAPLREIPLDAHGRD
ncbi:MAG: TerC family protein [Zoogloeaceae bacterium]|nr:TerC family protein [Rhodocyclaceae bacterium]MCP5232063.1 TerC family protein [Zoogloeaceae bacterium]MCP5241313.1 TerC family protein [Zoogloeaceae bacterium]MCP5255216.1 TerC family protein [Zoogloeaceae bacterium]